MATWLPPTQFVDLLACCSDAPSRAQRYAALVLLARELVARLALAPKDYRPITLPDQFGRPSEGHLGHFVYADCRAVDYATVSELLSKKGERDGTRLAPRYRAYSPPANGLEPARFPDAYGRTQTPGPVAAYELERATVEPLGEDLVDIVVAAMGADGFAAARVPHVTWLQQWFPDSDFA